MSVPIEEQPEQTLSSHTITINNCDTKYDKDDKLRCILCNEELNYVNTYHHCRIRSEYKNYKEFKIEFY